MKKMNIALMALVSLVSVSASADLIPRGTAVVSGRDAQQIWKQTLEVTGQTPGEFLRRGTQKVKVIEAKANIRCQQYDGSLEVVCQVAIQSPEAAK